MANSSNMVVTRDIDGLFFQNKINNIYVSSFSNSSSDTLNYVLRPTNINMKIFISCRNGFFATAMATNTCNRP